MLKRKFRLPRNIKFNNCRIISNPLFTIKTRENGLLINRFSIVVSKKIDKRAVVRNRIKRIISSCLEEVSEEQMQSYDMIIIAKYKTISVNKKEFCQELNQALK